MDQFIIGLIKIHSLIQTQQNTESIIIEEKNKIDTEEWLKNHKGKKRLLAITKNPKLNKKREVEYVVCSAEDITERKRRDEELDFQHQFQKTKTLK